MVMIWEGLIQAKSSQRKVPPLNVYIADFIHQVTVENWTICYCPSANLHHKEGTLLKSNTEQWNEPEVIKIKTSDGFYFSSNWSEDPELWKVSRF